MIRNIALSLFMLVPMLANAQLDSRFIFNGQNAEVLSAQKKVTIKTQVAEEVPDTCYRNVPVGEREVCHNETRYRQECSWIPSSENCWNETDRVCRPVTRYRQECSNGPDRRVYTDIPVRRVCTPNPPRQVCTSNPSRQECTDLPDRQVCEDKPGREVCTDRPTREVCTTRPDGRRHCTTVGGGRSCTTVGGGRECRTVDGGRECRTVGGGQSCTTVGGGETCSNVGGGQTCSTVPGERTCRQVAYTDQDCENVSRRRCETVPGRNECQNVPYSEPVCGMEMQYERESYACTRTRYADVYQDKTITAETQVQIITNGLVEEFPVAVSITESNDQYKDFSLDVKLLKEPKVFVVLKKKEIKIAQNAKEAIKLKANVVLEVLAEEMLPISFPAAVASATIEEASRKMTIIFEGQISSQGSVDLEVRRKVFLFGSKTLAKLKGDYPGEKVELGVVDGKAALSLDLNDSIQSELKKKGMKLKLELSSKMNLKGEIMNAKKPETSKLYEGTLVELK